jgi:hypothetical protein
MMRVLRRLAAKAWFHPASRRSARTEERLSFLLPSGTTLDGISSNLATHTSTFMEEAKASDGVVSLRETIPT